MYSDNCCTNRKRLSSEEVIKNKEIIVPPNPLITVSAKEIVVGGGNKERNDNRLNIDPAITESTGGIKATFQHAIENDLVLLYEVENVLFENLYINKNKVENEIKNIVEKIDLCPNLKNVITLGSLDEKGKVNSRTIKRLTQSFEDKFKDRFEKYEEVISSKGYCQSSGREIESGQLKRTSYKVKYTNGPINDRCCHHE